jgi:hypothetical protein
MSLLKRIVILFVLLATLMLPISASGDMSGSGQDSEGSISGDTGSTIIIETSGEYSGGYSGGYYPGSQSSFTGGYGGPTSKGITIGTNKPLDRPMGWVTNNDPDTMTKYVADGIDKLSQDLAAEADAYEKGTISISEYAAYLRSVNANVRTIKNKLDYLQWLFDKVTPQEISVYGPKTAISVTGHEG